VEKVGGAGEAAGEQRRRVMDLEAARARIADLESAVSVVAQERDRLAGERDALMLERDALAGERDAVSGQARELEAAQAALGDRLAETAGAHDAARAELAEARAHGLAYLRRALLAEHAGHVVPELVGGGDEVALQASVEVAKQAFGRALDAARVALARQVVPAGAPPARATDGAGLSALEMIESGLRR
jgi:hypothetical protein